VFQGRPLTSSRLPLLAVAGSSLLLALVLSWPLALHLGGWFRPSTFGASHAWAAEHLGQALLGGEPVHLTSQAGYPWLREARYIGWGLLPVIWSLRTLLSPLAAHQVVELVSLSLVALSAWPLLRRWTDAPPWGAAAACLVYAFCPYLLGNLAMGELPKLQAWCFPLFLLAADGALRDPRAWRGLVGVAVLGLLTSFTSPYYGLTLPLLAGAMALYCLLRRRPLLRPVLMLVCLAASLLPAWLYYRGFDEQLYAQLFMPARRMAMGDQLAHPHPVATLADLLLGSEHSLSSAWEPRHDVYLGLPLLLGLAALSSIRRGGSRGGRVGLALLAAGALLAMGPRLAWGERYLPLPLPAALLDLVGYPLARGGLYYRLVVVAALGLALWMAAESARHRLWVIWLLLAVHLGDALRETGPWPLPVEPVRGREALLQLRGRDDGAVMQLPLQESHSLAIGQSALLMATLHGRPTTALPRDSLTIEIPSIRDHWEQAFETDRAAAVLRSLGIRFVLADRRARKLSARHGKWLADLPEPDVVQDGIAIWDLGPTQLRPQPAQELLRRRERGLREARPSPERRGPAGPPAPRR